MNITQYKQRLRRVSGNLQGMLITTANYIMAHSCVNIAMFLPNRYDGDWTLAWLSTPRSEDLTDQLRFELFEIGGQIGRAVANSEKVVCGTNEEISRQIDEDVHWMSDFNMLFAPAVGEEPLIMLMLFVPAKVKFSDTTRRLMGEMAKALGEEIDKIAAEAREARDYSDDDEDGEMESGVQG